MLHFWTKEDPTGWDAAVAAHASDGGLLQSWAWGQFQEALGNGVYNVVNDDASMFAQALQLRAGKRFILSVPRGPICVGELTEARLQAWVADIKAFAAERGCFMVRFDPAWPMEQQTLLAVAGTDKAKRERNPSETLIIDIRGDEETLLGAMKSKWRYNIKLAQKKGVTVRFSTDPKDAQTFMSLVEKTTERQGFASYGRAYFEALINALGETKQGAFAIAEYQGKPIAALVVGFNGRTAYYLHGASDYEHRALMAPHLLQWAAIQESKKRGCVAYDFWGAGSQWGGVTRFKQGFAPTTALTAYVGTHEIGVKGLTYKLYRLRQRIRG